jgi:hypothetical protein
MLFWGPNSVSAHKKQAAVPDNFKPGASLHYKGCMACSSIHVLLWLRECSQGLFVLLDLAAGEHEILYLTRWWWLGEALGLWNTATTLTLQKYLWSLVSFSLFAAHTVNYHTRHNSLVSRTYIHTYTFTYIFIFLLRFCLTPREEA